MKGPAQPKVIFLMETGKTWDTEYTFESLKDPFNVNIQWETVLSVQLNLINVKHVPNFVTAKIMNLMKDNGSRRCP